MTLLISYYITVAYMAIGSCVVCVVRVVCVFVCVSLCAIVFWCKR